MGQTFLSSPSHKFHVGMGIGVGQELSTCACELVSTLFHTEKQGNFAYHTDIGGKKNKNSIELNPLYLVQVAISLKWLQLMILNSNKMNSSSTLVLIINLGPWARFSVRFLINILTFDLLFLNHEHQVNVCLVGLFLKQKKNEEFEYNIEQEILFCFCSCLFNHTLICIIMMRSIR